MRIAHLSDLHLSSDHFPERTDRFQQILRTCRDQSVDHLIITGDITNQARPKEFALARAILRDHGFLDPQRLTVTIGNHDIFGGPFYAEDVLTFPGTCRTTDYDAKVQEFARSFRETFEGCKYLSGSSIFPFVKIVQDAAFVGINSVARWSSLKNPLGSNGEVDDHQRKRLAEILSSGMFEGLRLFVLIHHHFHKVSEKEKGGALHRLWEAIESGTMKLRKKKPLFKLFREAQVDAVLHGHIHHHHHYERKKVRFHNAGGTMFPPPDRPAMIHLLETEKNGFRHTSVPVEERRTRRSVVHG